MTKKELLLSLAIDAVNWPEGSDFEMKELIHDIGFDDEIEKHYPEKFQNEDSWGDELYGFIRREVITYLKKLRKQVKDKAKRKKQIQDNVKKVNEVRERITRANTNWGILGKIKAIKKYRDDTYHRTGSTPGLLEAKNYVEGHGWTADGKYL